MPWPWGSTWSMTCPGSSRPTPEHPRGQEYLWCLAESPAPGLFAGRAARLAPVPARPLARGDGRDRPRDRRPAHRQERARVRSGASASASRHRAGVRSEGDLDPPRVKIRCTRVDSRATCKTLGVAARLSPPILRGEHPLFWISTACSGPEGPAASQETENKGIDVFSTERGDTGG